MKLVSVVVLAALTFTAWSKWNDYREASDDLAFDAFMHLDPAFTEPFRCEHELVILQSDADLRHYACHYPDGLVCEYKEAVRVKEHGCSGPIEVVQARGMRLMRSPLINSKEDILYFTLNPYRSYE